MEEYRLDKKIGLGIIFFIISIVAIMIGSIIFTYYHVDVYHVEGDDLISEEYSQPYKELGNFLGMFGIFISAPIGLFFIIYGFVSKNKRFNKIKNIINEKAKKGEYLINLSELAIEANVKPKEVELFIKKLIKENFFSGSFPDSSQFQLTSIDNNDNEQLDRSKNVNQQSNDSKETTETNQTSEERYNSLKEILKTVNEKIKSLTDKLANGEISSQAFTKANDNLEREKKELEEELWNLRNELFKDDYEKPF